LPRRWKVSERFIKMLRASFGEADDARRAVGFMKTLYEG
jgi:hypothetical protein